MVNAPPTQQQQQQQIVSAHNRTAFVDSNDRPMRDPDVLPLTPAQRQEVAMFDVRQSLTNATNLAGAIGAVDNTTLQLAQRANTKRVAENTAERLRDERVQQLADTISTRIDDETTQDRLNLMALKRQVKQSEQQRQTNVKKMRLQHTAQGLGAGAPLPAQVVDNSAQTRVNEVSAQETRMVAFNDRKKRNQEQATAEHMQAPPIRRVKPKPVVYGSASAEAHLTAAPTPSPPPPLYSEAGGTPILPESAYGNEGEYTNEGGRGIHPTTMLPDSSFLGNSALADATEPFNEGDLAEITQESLDQIYGGPET
jgi:hypothetical protein